MKLERMVVTYAKTINVASVQHRCNQILHIDDYDYDDIFSECERWQQLHFPRSFTHPDFFLPSVC